MDSYYGQTILIFIVLISSCAGLGHSCACSSNLKHCANIYQIPADFQTAQENCRERGGQFSIQPNASDKVFGFLLDNMIGHFWIGQHFPKDKCSSNTSALREREMTTELTNLESAETACVPLCVSVSSDRTLTVKPCAEKLDGFLCEDPQEDLCRGSVVILDNARCMYAPCEHTCIPMETGYRCSCRERFRPNARDPRRCDFYCATSVCEALCMKSGTACWCPDGFVRSEQTCVDIDECESNHDCAHMCINTIGSYRCDCFQPFILVNGSECVLDLSGQVFTTPSPNYIARGSLSTPGEYVGLIIFLVVAAFALLVLVRYLRGRKATVQECNPPDYDEFQGSVAYSSE
ncbi:thrombomodulin [Rhinichthys klamathensis goyatoka]|uniref:thrombomodulin n=1 Tax=Rhinichthys klamathensis goyatoka TaxID=3034132 RepID=UPI0024B5B28C|nr:thrombomodulin [Rhinichthys klamathensis goyatoka]